MPLRCRRTNAAVVVSPLGAFLEERTFGGFAEPGWPDSERRHV